MFFSGHAQIVHLLLERNKFGTIPSDSQGATPLHYAAQSNFAVSSAYLKCKVSVFCWNIYSVTKHLGCFWSHINSVSTSLIHSFPSNDINMFNFKLLKIDLKICFTNKAPWFICLRQSTWYSRRYFDGKQNNNYYFTVLLLFKGWFQQNPNSYKVSRGRLPL